MSDAEALYTISAQAQSLAKEAEEIAFAEPLNALEAVANRVGKSWSGSWLGYHACVYYQNLELPPPGARFSQEWGFMDAYSIQDTIGDWVEFAFDDVEGAVLAQAGNPDLEPIKQQADTAKDRVEDLQARLVSALTRALRADDVDTYLKDIFEHVKKLRVFSPTEFEQLLMPSGRLMSRDMVAIQKGAVTPPHLVILVRVRSARSPYLVAREIAKYAQRAASHLSDANEKAQRKLRIGTNVFIGHGRAPAWKDLRDFVRDRVHLPWDEFNRVPVAGFTNIARLSQMLDGAAVAFLILTAEDEQADGKMHARMNVIHEAGLFQGRLGFEKAILLLEAGCEEFSNVQGLGQIRFPQGNIAAAFEDVRQVLEREGLIE